MGMNVLFYDVLQIMPLGTATPVESLDELLEQVDFLTLHVPETQDTKNMIGCREFERMKRGSYVINASRGSIVDLDALSAALKSGQIGGAAIVFLSIFS